MAQKVYIVEGRQFRTEAEYRKALRDKQIIDRLREQVDFQDRRQLAGLVKVLQQKKYPFHTLLGQDFLEETEDILQKLSKSPPSGGRKRGGQTAAGSAGKSLRKGKTASAASSSVAAGSEQMDKYVQEELKRREKIRKRLALLCGAVAVGCLGYFGIYTFQAVRTQQEFARIAAFRERAEDLPYPEVVTGPVIHYTQDGERVIPEVLDEYKNLYNSNKRLIGWLKIDDTIIDYPVMQTSNNEYYLDHNFNQEKDNNGSIFMDKECVAYPRSQNLILYGHHMRSGKMFGDLEKYAKESYYKEHSIIQFDTIYEKGTYQVMYVFRAKVLKENEIAFKYYQFIDAISGEEFNSYMKEMEEMSLYDTGVTAGYGDDLLTLSTCDNSQTDGRFVVVAKRVQ